MKRIILVILPMIFCANYSVQASGVTTLTIDSSDVDYNNGRYQLEPYLYVIPDPNRTYSFEDISNTDSIEFRPLKRGELSEIQNHTRYFWLRLTIKSNLQEDLNWLINFGFPEVILYVPQEDSTHEITYTGTHLENKSPILRYSHLPLVSLSLAPKETKTIYVRVQATIHLYLGNKHFLDNQLVLLDAEEETEHGREEWWKFGLSLGILFVIVIYHLLLFYYNRTTSDLAVANYSLMLSTIAIHYHKFDVMLMNSRHNAWLYDKDFLIMQYVTVSIIILIRSFYDVKRELPVLSRILTWSLFLQLSVTAIFGYYFLFDKQGFYDITYALGNELLGLFPAVILLFSIVVFVIFLYQRKSVAIYLNVGIGLFILYSILILLGTNLDVQWLPQGVSLKIVMILSGLVISFASVRRLKLIYDEQQEANRKKIIAEQQELSKQEEIRRLKELDQVKTNLYNNITHEFRTPLTVVEGMVNEMPDTFKHKPMILRNTKRLLHMINQMLELSKLESRSIEPQCIKDDIISFLHYQTEALSSMANRKLISLNFYSSLDKLIVDFDPNNLETILTNLLSNAIKFTPDYGKVIVVAEREEEDLLIKVKDTGIGISKEKLPFIFDRFYQAFDNMHRTNASTGIGLAIVEETIKVLEGRIEAVSEEGVGTEFKVYLPIRNESPDTDASAVSVYKHQKWENMEEIDEGKPEPENRDPYFAKLLRASKEQILIVEDNLDVVTYLKTCLSPQYGLLVANNGKHGVDLAIENTPDLILCDVMMPELDGFQVCQKVKEDLRTCHIPIILLTAKASQENKIEGLSYGADAYLTKPFNKQELLVRIQNLVSLRKRLHARFTEAEVIPNEMLESEGLNVKDQAFIQKLTDYIREKITEENLEVVYLQREMELSRTQLHKKLKALTGMSTSQFRKSVRLYEAKKLLEGSENLTISEVAYKVGYKYANHFARDFKDMFGKTPSEYK